LEDAMTGLGIKPDNEHSLYMAALNMHGLGLYEEAIMWYEGTFAYVRVSPKLFIKMTA
jgi:hypothetical protein